MRRTRRLICLGVFGISLAFFENHSNYSRSFRKGLYVKIVKIVDITKLGSENHHLIERQIEYKKMELMLVTIGLVGIQEH